MIMRVLNLMVIGALIAAAAYVYRIKFDSTVQAEHLAKLRSEVRHERDTIAALRAEWGELDNPVRIEALAKRFLKLKPLTATQLDALDRLPERPSPDLQAAGKDPMAGMIENLEESDVITGSLPPSSGTLPDSPDNTPAPNAAPNLATSPATSPATDGAPKQ